MRAVRFRRYGGPEVLEIDDVPEPAPGHEQVRIRVHAAGVNAADWKQREGMFAGGEPLGEPRGVGFDAAGVVDAVGAGVAGVEPGDRVFGSGRDTFAEAAVLSAWAAMPKHMGFEEAAATPLPVATALRLLTGSGVREGDTIAVSGAAGGVGSALVQLARERGVIVVGTASAENQEYLEALGVLGTTYDAGWPERVRELAAAGIDAAFDLAGAGVIPELVSLTRDPATVWSIADFSAPEHGAKVVRGAGGGRDAADALSVAVRLFESGDLRMIVERTFPLERTAAAQELSRAGHGRGRTIVLVA